MSWIVKSDSPTNYVSYSNPQVDALIDKWTLSLDKEARLAGSSVATALGLKQPLSPIATAMTVSLDTPERMAIAAAALADVPLLKVKVDRNDPADDLRRDVVVLDRRHRHFDALLDRDGAGAVLDRGGIGADAIDGCQSQGHG